MKQPTLYLRIGVEEDVDVVVDLSRDLFSNSVYSVHSVYDPSVVRDNYVNSLRLGNSRCCTILLHRGEKCIGFLVCSKQNPAFTKDVYATELGFWIYPEYKTAAGMKMLIEAYYYWARKTGCKAALMGKLNKNKVESYRMKVLV